MLQEKTDEVEKLKQELKHSETDLNLQQYVATIIACFFSRCRP